MILDLINELNENVEMIKPKKKAFKKRLAAKLLISLNSMTDVSVAKSLIDVVRKINDVDQVIDSAAFKYLRKAKNVMLSPHAASATDRMRPETRRRAAREVRLVLEGKWPMSCVNPTVLPKVDLERWQPYPMNRGPNR